MHAQILRFAAPAEEFHTDQSLSTIFDLRNIEPEARETHLSLFSGDGLPGDIPQRSRETLTEALSIYMALEDHIPLVEVARMTENIHAFGIGHLLYNGLRKKLINAEMSAADILDRVYRADMTRPRDGQVNRHRVIHWLKKLGLVASNTTDRMLKPAGTTPCLKALGDLISERTKLPFDLISSESRKKDVVRARFQAIWVLRMVCGHPLTMIGQNMGNRDHTTILNSINKVNLNIQADVAFRRSMENLCEKADTIGIIQNRNLLLRATRHLS